MENDSNITASIKKMRVYQLDRPGSLDGLVLAERDIPSPSAGEVLVRVRASSINVRDLMILNGEYPMPVPPGRVPLSDGAGEVVAVGAGVRRSKVGDRSSTPSSRTSSADRSMRCPNNLSSIKTDG
jgi:NADPH:quinone reductase-like Zn-dependent oxidoreductase